VKKDVEASRPAPRTLMTMGRDPAGSRERTSPQKVPHSILTRPQFQKKSNSDQDTNPRIHFSNLG